MVQLPAVVLAHALIVPDQTPQVALLTNCLVRSTHSAAVVPARSRLFQGTSGSMMHATTAARNPCVSIVVKRAESANARVGMTRTNAVTRNGTSLQASSSTQDRKSV